MGCQGWFNARVRSCGVLDDALKTAEQADGAAYIEVITDAYEAPPMYKPRFTDRLAVRRRFLL